MILFAFVSWGWCLRVWLRTMDLRFREFNSVKNPIKINLCSPVLLVYTIVMNSGFSRKRTNLGARYGLIAGLFFTLAAWGVDALVLSRSHAALPLLKFVPALVVCIPAAVLAGYLTAKFEKALLGLLFWGGLAVLFTYLVINLPQKFTAWYLHRLGTEPVRCQFEPLIGLGGYWFYCLFAIGITCLLCGFLENVLIDQGLSSSSEIGPLMPSLICALIMLGSGVCGDLLMTRDFRRPVVELDKVLNNAAVYYDQDVDDATRRALRLGSVDALGDLALEPHSLILVATDRYLTLSKVMVKFENGVALCQTVLSQPTFCKIINSAQETEGFLGLKNWWKSIKLLMCYNRT